MICNSEALYDGNKKALEQAKFIPENIWIKWGKEKKKNVTHHNSDIDNGYQMRIWENRIRTLDHTGAAAPLFPDRETQIIGEITLKLSSINRKSWLILNLPSLGWAFIEFVLIIYWLIDKSFEYCTVGQCLIF